MKYNQHYYLQNKIKLNQKRSENYYKNKYLKTLNKYINNHLNEDMITIKDKLLKIDENIPKKRDRCIELMKIAKMLLVIKLVTLHENSSKIEIFHL